MPLPILAAIAAATSIYQGIKGIQQSHEADELKKRDTTPPAFTEALQLGRQGAAAAALPGAGAQLNRIQAGTNDTLDAAERAGTSASSIAGLLEKADANRQQALADLGTREDAYHEQKNQGLVQMLNKAGVYQDRDQQEYDKNEAALNEASQRNIYGAVDKGAQVAAYFINKAKNKDSGTDDSDLPIGTPTKPKRVGYNRFGIPDLAGIYES